MSFWIVVVSVWKNKPSDSCGITFQSIFHAAHQHQWTNTVHHVNFRKKNSPYHYLLANCGYQLWYLVVISNLFNTLRPRQNGRHFADDNLKCIFLNENAWILIEIPLKFVHKGSINNIPALVRIMAWRRPADKPLSEPMLVRIPTHICVTRPQWVN